MLLTGVLAAAAGTWSRTFDGRGRDQALAVGEAVDGAIVVAGTTGDVAEFARTWLVVLEADGSLRSESTLGSLGPGFGSGPDGAALAPDGGAIFTGRDVLDIFTMHHAWVVRTDAAGGSLWAVRFFTPPLGVGFGRHFLVDASPTADGGVVAAGSTSVTDGDPAHPWLVKLGPTGELEWQQEYAGVPADARVVRPRAGGYVVAGRSQGGAGLGDAWVMVVDSTGSPQWSRTWGGPGQDELTGVALLADGGLALSGSTDSFTASGHAAWALRLDAAGALVWHAVMGDGEWSDFQDVATVAADGLLFTGRIGEPGRPTNDLWLVRLEAASGVIERQRAHEGDSGDWGERAIALADGSLAIAATWASGFDEERAWVLRLGPQGTVGPCPLVRETAIPASAPALVETDLALSPVAPSAVAGPQVFAAGTGLQSQETRCESPGCSAQGNRLFAVRRDGDVELTFPGAPAPEWRMYRDPSKLAIGSTALPPDVSVPAFVDAGAARIGDSYYYYLRGLCDGIPGP